MDSQQQLIDFLQKKCNKMDYGENKMKCILKLLSDFNLININENVEYDKEAEDIHQIALKSEHKQIPFSPLRYKTEYTQLSLLGYGGYGKVYTVKNILDTNVYAIKKAFTFFSNFNSLKSEAMSLKFFLILFFFIFFLNISIIGFELSIP